MKSTLNQLSEEKLKRLGTFKVKVLKDKLKQFKKEKINKNVKSASLTTP